MSFQMGGGAPSSGMSSEASREEEDLNPGSDGLLRMLPPPLPAAAPPHTTSAPDVLPSLFLTSLVSSSAPALVVTTTETAADTATEPVAAAAMAQDAIEPTPAPGPLGFHESLPPLPHASAEEAPLPSVSEHRHADSPLPGPAPAPAPEPAPAPGPGSGPAPTFLPIPLQLPLPVDPASTAAAAPPPPPPPPPESLLPPSSAGSVSRFNVPPPPSGQPSLPPLPPPPQLLPPLPPPPPVTAPASVGGPSTIVSLCGSAGAVAECGAAPTAAINSATSVHNPSHHLYYSAFPQVGSPVDDAPTAAAATASAVATATPAATEQGAAEGTAEATAPVFGTGTGALPPFSSVAVGSLSTVEAFRIQPPGLVPPPTMTAPSGYGGGALEDLGSSGAVELMSDSSHHPHHHQHQHQHHLPRLLPQQGGGHHHHHRQRKQQQRRVGGGTEDLERPDTPPQLDEVEMKGNAPWTPEEDEKLRQAVTKHSLKHWKKIARHVPGRTAVQCLQHYKHVLHPDIERGSWSPEEDKEVLKLVGIHGLKWATIASKMRHRLGKRIRERWVNHLDPSLKTSEWTPAEERILIQKHNDLGSKWSKIAKFLPGRSVNSVKNHWSAVSRGRGVLNGGGRTFTHTPAPSPAAPAPAPPTTAGIVTGAGGAGDSDGCGSLQISVGTGDGLAASIVTNDGLTGNEWLSISPMVDVAAINGGVSVGAGDAGAGAGAGGMGEPQVLAGDRRSAEEMGRGVAVKARDEGAGPDGVRGPDQLVLGADASAEDQETEELTAAVIRGEDRPSDELSPPPQQQQQQQPLPLQLPPLLLPQQEQNQQQSQQQPDQGNHVYPATPQHDHHGASHQHDLHPGDGPRGTLTGDAGVFSATAGNVMPPPIPISRGQESRDVIRPGSAAVRPVRRHPTVAKRWKERQSRKLRALVEKSGAKDWTKIAREIPGKTDLQCMLHWNHVINPDLTKGKGSWRPEEDARILELVKQCGHKWSVIAQMLKRDGRKQCRVGKQIRERYLHHLNPDLKKGGWTTREEEMLIIQHQLHQNKWAQIAKALPGRCDNDIKNHWYAHERRERDAVRDSARLLASEGRQTNTPESALAAAGSSAGSQAVAAAASAAASAAAAAAVASISAAVAAAAASASAVSAGRERNYHSPHHHQHHHHHASVVVPRMPSTMPPTPTPPPVEPDQEPLQLPPAKRARVDDGGGSEVMIDGVGASFCAIGGGGAEDDDEHGYGMEGVTEPGQFEDSGDHDGGVLTHGNELFGPDETSSIDGECAEDGGEDADGESFDIAEGDHDIPGGDRFDAAVGVGGGGGGDDRRFESARFEGEGSSGHDGGVEAFVDDGHDGGDNSSAAGVRDDDLGGAIDNTGEFGGGKTDGEDEADSVLLHGSVDDVSVGTDEDGAGSFEHHPCDGFDEGGRGRGGEGGGGSGGAPDRNDAVAEVGGQREGEGAVGSDGYYRLDEGGVENGCDAGTGGPFDDGRGAQAEGEGSRVCGDEAHHFDATGGGDAGGGRSDSVVGVTIEEGAVEGICYGSNGDGSGGGDGGGGAQGGVTAEEEHADSTGSIDSVGHPDDAFPGWDKLDNGQE